MNNPARPTIVLIHGAFVDGSGWRGVYDLLCQDGYPVRVLQQPTISLDGDVAAVHRMIEAQGGGPVVLVGHSYGGVIITEAGNHPAVKALVYIAAFAPDRGESVASLNQAPPPPGAPVPPIVPQDGFLWIDREQFPQAFAGDVDEATARFMADSQQPWGVAAPAGPVSEAAWRSKPSWYLVATDDRMIPPAAQRGMAARAGAAVTETPGSHAVFVSRPAVVAEIIARAAQAVAG